MILISLHRGVNLNGGSHRRGEGHGLEVATLDGCGTGPLQLLAQRVVVLDQAIQVEGLLTYYAVDDAVAVDAVLYLAALYLLDGPADVLRYGAALRVRHEPARTEDGTELAHRPHLVGGRDGHVEVHEALILDAGRKVIRAYDVGPCILGLPGLLAFGEDGDPARLARAVRQHQRAPHHLICASRVDVQVDVGLDALVELRAFEVLQQLQRLPRRVALFRIYPRLLFQQLPTHRP